MSLCLLHFSLHKKERFKQKRENIFSKNKCDNVNPNILLLTAQTNGTNKVWKKNNISTASLQQVLDRGKHKGALLPFPLLQRHIVPEHFCVPLGPMDEPSFKKEPVSPDLHASNSHGERGDPYGHFPISRWTPNYSESTPGSQLTVSGTVSPANTPFSCLTWIGTSQPHRIPFSLFCLSCWNKNAADKLLPQA